VYPRAARASTHRDGLSTLLLWCTAAAAQCTLGGLGRVLMLLYVLSAAAVAQPSPPQPIVPPGGANITGIKSPPFVR
jgi:hypothetical protein